jgi:ADP-ribose pyrophosphatase YjhB (NUDIX family)
LDLIGGVLNFGEQPIQCIIREVQEETNVTMTESQFFYLGVSKEQSDSGSWLSHVYVAVCPEEIAEHIHVEVYSIDTFDNFKHSGMARPRQVWMARHLDFLHNRFENWLQVWVLCQQLWGVLGTHLTSPPTPLVWSMVSKRVQTMLEDLKKSGMTRQEVYTLYRSKRIWLDDQMADLVFGVDLNAPPTRVMSTPIRNMLPPMVSPPDKSTLQVVKWTGWDVNPPKLLDDVRALLLVIVSGKKKMSAQMFYKRTRECGFKGTRVEMTELIERAIQLKLVMAVSVPQGREFHFTL